jgi:DNA invertase Pin-like site-specific DNA recombinase
MTKYTIAKYIRLSIEDGVTESMSIPHQRLILDRHIDELDIPNAAVLEFIDNGYSGVNMERPAVQELLELVRSGRINAICTKDFSRFSRSAMDSGYFIEQVFPLYRVRFIAVNDRFDSEDYKNDTGGIDVAFKFLMHEYYSADLSKKVRSAKRAQMIRGENIVKNAVYGYRKNEQSGKWEPDPEAADVVLQVFQMAQNGLPPAVIRDKLCEMRVPTPEEYKKLKRGYGIVPLYRWEARAIRVMLTNEQYIGSFVSGKQENKAIGSHSKICTDKSEWIVIPDRHPPIVSKEMFAEVQTLLETQLWGKHTEKPVERSWQDAKQTKRRDQMKNGEYYACNPVYGYVKSGEKSVAVDEAAAVVIREIFEYARQGLSYAEIAAKLSESGYPVPNEHIALNKGKSITPACKWTNKCVRVILQNVQYTGAYVSGKIVKNAETGKLYHTPQSEWIIIPGKNPAIIGQEFFDEVQEILSKSKPDRRRNYASHEYLLRGVIKCGCCGFSMTYDPLVVPVYRCTKSIQDPTADCHKLKVVASELDEAVMTVARKQAEVVLGIAELSSLRKSKTEATHISECERQIRERENERQKCYERFVLREINREMYQAEKADLTAQIDRLTNQLVVLRQHETDKLSLKKTAAKAKDVLNETITPRETVELLVKEVKVFPGKNIEIEWKIADFTLQG